MRRITLATSSALLLGVGLAACGGSSKAPGVVQAPSGGATQASVTAATTTSPSPTATTPTATTPTATTPKPPSPLSKKPAVTVPKGPAPKSLVVKDLIKGNGPAAKDGSKITVNYVGALYKNGKEFSSTWSAGQPFTTTLVSGGVIPGWVKGIPGMKVGGRRELIIPAALAYGKAGSGSTIPPNSPLVFVVDLLGVQGG
jgi:peptidylprolyl isomerase